MKNFSYLSQKAEIRNSPVANKGVFAKAGIKKGEIVTVAGGYIFTEKELDDFSKKGLKIPLSHSHKIADNFYIGSFGEKEINNNDYINHSCQPNIGLRGDIIFVAMKNIKPGEEIVYDYAMTDDDLGDYLKCNCGAKSCRKIIKGSDWKIPALQKKYKRYFSWHIREKIKKQKKK